METYVNDKKVTLGSQYNYNVAASEIANLIGVGRRDDGKLHLADICVGKNINPWAKNKPFISNNPFFNDTTERENARKEQFYGLSINVYDVTDNSYISRLSFSNSLPYNFFKRIRDFDGYDHNAKSGVQLKSHSTASVSETITLETNPDTGSNITMKDLLLHSHAGSGDLSFNPSLLNSFQWVFVDWFGFIHTLSGVMGKDTLLAYLFGNSTKITVNLYETFFSATDGGYLNVNYIPPKKKIGSKSYLSLAGSESNYSNKMVLLNPISFGFDTLNSVPVFIEGFSPDMIVGTSARGKGYLRNNLYDGVKIKCANDDFLFLGFTITNLENTITSMSNIKVYLFQGGSQLPKSTPLCSYNDGLLDANISLGANKPIGVSKPSDGGLTTGWAKGMLYIRMSNTWSRLVDGAGYFAIVYENTDKLPYTRQLLTPYIRLTFENTNKTVASYGDINATLPEVQPTPPNWSDILV